MNILILNSIGKKKWGGGESWMVLIARELQQRGHTIRIGCRRNSIIKQNAETNQLPVIAFDIYTDFSILGIAQLIKAVNTNNIDVIIACQNRDVRVAGFARMLTCKKTPLIIARQGIKRIHNSWKYRFTFTRLCDSIVTNTASLKEEFDSYGWWDPNHVQVIHNGAEIVNADAEPLDIRQLIDCNKDSKPIIVSTTCRLAKQKNLELLIDAASEIIKQDNRYYFLIAGKGRERKALQQRINMLRIGHRVKLVGFVPDVNQLLKASDIFVLPSAYEGMSNSIIEAMLANLPVVCSAVNGANELINDGENGLLFHPSDTQVLISHLLMLSNPSERQRLGNQAHNTIVTQFSSTLMGQSYERYIEELLAKKQQK